MQNTTCKFKRKKNNEITFPLLIDRFVANNENPFKKASSVVE